MSPDRGLPRWVEVPLVLIGLVLASPLLVLAALSVAVSSRGPVLFRQQRVGREGRPFTLLKFRTMPVGSGGLGETLRGGNRVTPVGRVLRALKIDELPELWNVARGDMALVGPRPEVPEYVDMTNPLWREVLSARPGITDPVTLRLRSEEQLLAQAGVTRESFYRSTLQPYKLRGYRDYIAVRSWKTDVRVLWRSVVGIAMPSRVNPPSEKKLYRRPTFEGDQRHAGSLGPMKSASVSSRPLWGAVCDLSLVILSNYWAFWLRFDGSIPPAEIRLWSETVLALLVIRGLVFLPLGFFSGLWRYTSVSDLRTIIVGIAGSSVLFYVLIHLALGLSIYPRSVFLIDLFLLICLIGGLRLAYRLVPRQQSMNRDRRVLILGAGDAAETVVRELRHAPYHRYEPIGFIDEDRAKVGGRIHGLPILGTIDDLSTVMVEHDPDEVLIALPQAHSAEFDRIMCILDRFNAAITTLPYVDAVPKKGFALSQIRRVALEDLLPRESSQPGIAELRHQLAGKRVLVTGAAGAVGAEICQQLVGMAEAVILFDRHERGLSDVMDKVSQLGGKADIRPVIGDVVDERALRSAVAENIPDIIIHAANYRHEGLLASNVCEVVRNNVLGARLVVEAAGHYSVSRVLLLSSRFAADPTSAVGATLWLAESLVRAAALNGRSRFAALRLGPILSHDEGIVRRFTGQIATGRAVTVSHPAAEQAFLFPAEAAYLALRIAASTNVGGVFAASAGRLRVLDLAKTMIRLSGLTPDDDVPITFVGLKQGEKLNGSLVGLAEVASASSIAGAVQIAAAPYFDPRALSSQIQSLEQTALDGNSAEVTRQLMNAVPGLHLQTVKPRQTVRHDADRWIGGPAVSDLAR